MGGAFPKGLPKFFLLVSAGTADRDLCGSDLFVSMHEEPLPMLTGPRFGMSHLFRWIRLYFSKVC